VQVPGDTLDPDTNTMYDPSRADGRYVVNFRDDKYGDARITAVNFGSGSRNLIFDALGGPVSAPDSDSPGPGGTIRVQGSGQAFIITVEAFTGRTTVRRDDPVVVVEPGPVGPGPVVVIPEPN
jgi:hypothetical protein